MDAPVELRQLRYFVAVAEELHFGRAAARLHMSQSPLSRAIRELERDLGAVLFVRTTRRVELTAAGTALLARARRAIAEVDLAVAEARRAGAEPGLAIGHGPLSRTPARRLAEALGGREVRLAEDLSPELLRRVAAHELTAAVVLETPPAARPSGVRMIALRDEPLLAAVPAAHRLAGAAAVPLGAFAAERVLLPRPPIGTSFTIGCERGCGSPGTSCTTRWRRSARRGTGGCSPSPRARRSRSSPATGRTRRSPGSRRSRSTRR